jgi:septal ring factor EnvC (AmiA/AmiB activator)
MNKKEREEGIKSRIKSIGTTITDALSHFGAAGAKLAEAVANVTATMTAWPLAIVTLVIVAALITLVAIVLLVVAAFTAWKNSLPTEQLKKANEELKRTTEEMERAKEASESLKESIKGYEEAVDVLHGLTKGTAEYKEALQKANDAARELIDNNPELAGQYSFNSETGLIEFKDGALEATQAARDK